ncbi:MAG: hypothetical protein L6408_00190 [Nanoarchaeota archaeon]|nr:hypothetical protein [Nanoarchaeota archaeon]
MLEDVNDLKPIVKKTVKTLYGDDVKSIRIFKTEKYPIFGSSLWWRVHTEFRNEENRFIIEIDIHMRDGTVIKTNEVQREDLK